MGQWPAHVGFTQNEVNFRNELQRLKVTDDGINFDTDTSAAITHRLVSDRGGFTLIITMPMNPRLEQEQNAALIAHEATHVADMIFERYGEREPGLECRAYLVQYITQRCLYVMRENRKRKREKKPLL